jgi:uncharacterized protein with gpF-like domain
MARKPAFIRHSRRREAEIQARLLRALEGRFRRRVAAVVAEQSYRYLTAYRSDGVVPAENASSREAFSRLYQQIAEDAARVFGARVVTQGKALGHILERKNFVDMFRGIARAWVQGEAVRRRITYVSETTRQRIVDEVDRGQRDGLGIDNIAEGISERIPQISRHRGALIARTETHGAANHAMHETAKETGLPLVKEWVSTEDRRTRRFGKNAEYDHHSMNGQTRPMDEPFSMPRRGGRPLEIMYPGEVGKPGAATINCRCAVVHTVEGLDD